MTFLSNHKAKIILPFAIKVKKTKEKNMYIQKISNKWWTVLADYDNIKEKHYKANQKSFLKKKEMKRIENIQ